MASLASGPLRPFAIAGAMVGAGWAGGEWDGVRNGIADAIQETPWPLQLVVIALVVAVRDRATAVIVTLLAAYGSVDLRAAIGGMILGQAIGAGACFFRGRGLRRRSRPRVIGQAESARTPRGWSRMLFRRPIRTALATRFVPGEHTLAFMAAGYHRRFPWGFVAASAGAWALWAAFYAGVTLALVSLVVFSLDIYLGWPGVWIGGALALIVPRVLALLLTPHGQRRLVTRAWRATHREFWPSSLFYLPLVPYLAYLSARRRGPMVFTCCNPGIEGGGGIVGESKRAILDALAQSGGEHMLPYEFIPAGGVPAQRAERVLGAMKARPELGAFPVVLKPDRGFRGYAFKLCRGPEDVRAYLRQMTGPAILQAYHPGPFECGVLWARYPDGERGGRAGFIFSITRKDFPRVEGDGRRTLEELIYDHPRYQAQAATFLQRFAGQRERILAPGESLRLSESGNHTQGALFRDGSDLITPALEDAIDRIARGFSPRGERPDGRTPGRPLLDIGRFDLRYESDELLRQGRGFGVLEFNGTAGESTNVYDPERSIFWTYRVLARHWRLLYDLGAARRDQGASPVGLLQLARFSRAYTRARTGPAIAD
jgi:membrane protein DedA with SNARE-associated domain